MTNPTEDVVRRYYAVVGDLGATEADLTALLHPDVEIVEHPNRLVPTGASRDLAGTVQGFQAGRALLSRQSFEVLQVLTAGDEAAVRALWSGEIGREAGPFRPGQVLTAQVAAFLTVEDGRIRRHETFDCYQPFPLDR